MTASRTPLAIVRDHVEDWRKSKRWSRETVVDAIVQAHERLGLDRLTGIHFDPPTRDTFERMRVNADRVFRWLDDSTKDKNLLPFNFIWSVLAAMPMERRLAMADTLLAPVDLGAREEIAEATGLDADQDHTVLLHFQAMVSTSADAQVAMSQLLDGIDAGEPEQAKVKLSRTATAIQRALCLMSRLLHRRKKPGGQS
ncbi:MAG: hypothetical protein PHQ05_05060 [Sterolibacterium sp.]|nr:hypothetical protein [Sterolibacterium sp.]